MLHHRCGLVGDGPAAQTHAPAEIGVLVVRKERLIESTDILQHLAPQQCRPAAEAEDFLAALVLANVSFPAATVSATAVAKQEQTGILDDIRAVGEDQLAGHRAQPLARFSSHHERGQPAWSDPSVVVEDHDVLAQGGSEGGVIATGETAITADLHES